MADDGFLLQVRGLRKSFGANEVLRGIDLDQKRRGRLPSVSGSGKSTLLRCLNRLRRARVAKSVSQQADSALWRGRRSTHRRAQREGMVFQQFNLWPHLGLEKFAGADHRPQGAARMRAKGSVPPQGRSGREG